MGAKESGSKRTYLDLFDGVANSGQVEITDRGSSALMTKIKLSEDADILLTNLPQELSLVYYLDSPYFVL